MKIKVCGMTQQQNLEEVGKLDPDYIGFIFYPGSKRYMRNTLLPANLKQISAKKTGVFVNASQKEVVETVMQYGLDAVQLHGDETPQYCKSIQQNNVEVIKAFKVDESFDFSTTTAFEDSCNYFLFDTKGRNQGGNGEVFNWRLLENYDQRIPFFLSGGIGLHNVKELPDLKEMNLYGIDVNSCTETSEGIKDANIIKEIMEHVKHF